jgi:hypothetical protein
MGGRRNRAGAGKRTARHRAMATVTAERRAHANSYGLLLLQRRASRSRHGDAVAVIHHGRERSPGGLCGEKILVSEKEHTRGSDFNHGKVVHACSIEQ